MSDTDGGRWYFCGKEESETPKKLHSGLPKKESLGSVSERNTSKMCFPNAISLGNRSGRQQWEEPFMLLAYAGSRAENNIQLININDFSLSWDAFLRILDLFI
jgi:hypothetical protein